MANIALADWFATTSAPLQIFLDAGLVEQVVIVGLLLASIASWSIILNRLWIIRREYRTALALKRAMGSMDGRDDLRVLGDQDGSPINRILNSITMELHSSSGTGPRTYGPVRDRIISMTEVAIAEEGRQLAGRSAWLATIATSAPFVGLFGTVWGIMESFLAIGQTQDTSLAIVAPGIAQALMATAAGLFCAIPAAIGYNRVLQGLADVDAEWRSISSLTEVEISREFDLPR